MTQYLGILILGALSIGGVIGLWLWAAEQDRLRAQRIAKGRDAALSRRVPWNDGLAQFLSTD